MHVEGQVQLYNIKVEAMGLASRNKPNTYITRLCYNKTVFICVMLCFNKTLLY